MIHQEKGEIHQYQKIKINEEESEENNSIDNK